MGWNEPGKGKDPWTGKKQPPDLDEALKRFQDKLKKALSGGSGSSGDDPSDSGNRSAGLLVSITLLIVFILWALSGIFIVDPAEQAAILQFGRYKETVGPGPHWIPRMIQSKEVVNVERVSDYSYSAQMLTQDENLVSVSVVVQYRIGDLQAYLFNVADPEESLQQATSSALRQVVGTTTLDQIITEGREAWGIHVQDALVNILKIYNTGIVVVNVSPQPARAPENVQDAFDDAIKAREDERRFKDQADAYAARVVPIAKGNAKRIIAEAKARAGQVVFAAKGDVAEFLALLPAYKEAPFVTAQRMYFSAIQKVLTQTSKVVVDGKSGNLLYLPLDKLMTQSEPVLPGLKPLTENTSMPMSVNEDDLADGRNTLRQTMRQGENS